jgi:hypothetical protein
MPVIFDSVTGIVPPNWTTNNRPTNPNLAQMGFNTSNQTLEYYAGSNVWATMGNTTIGNSYPVEVLMIGGGGGSAGGTNFTTGGGGAGGVVYLQSTALVRGTSYGVVIGAGGSAGPNSYPYSATNGGTTSFNWVQAIGGGTSSPSPGSVSNITYSTSGGSGGGGSSYALSSQIVVPGAQGVPGQGYAGGSGYYVSGSDPYPMCSGGGGGAFQVGQSYQTSPQVRSGKGGDGIASSITGTLTYYAGGGGGGGCTGSYASPPGAGGIGGGGAGTPGALISNNGGTNLGGGAGGGGFNSSTPYSGAAGGSGIVIIKYYGPPRGTGGTIVSQGGFTVHTFTSSGTYVA